MSLNGNQASNGSNAPDPNIVKGWNVQANVGAQQGYAQTGNGASAAALASTGNGTPGAPAPLAGHETDILANPGYGNVSPSLITIGTQLASALVPVPASNSAFTNPAGLTAQVVITGTVSSVKVNGVQFGTAAGTYTVPAGSTITLTYATAPTWTWTLI